MARRPAQVHGFCLVDKPAGMTSHDVVGRLRRRFNERRIGHSGTLDPDATGVLIVAVGNATRLLRFFSDLPKTYTAWFITGAATDTLDDSGAVTRTADMSAVTLDDARRVAASLTGRIMQVPPMVSAIKIDGKRLHELAREGITVERDAREIEVYSFDVDGPVEVRNGNPVFDVTVTCSSGTYVRTLADDFGAALGGCAHLGSLRRRAVGEFRVGESPRDADSIDNAELRTVSAGLAHLPRVVVDDEVARWVLTGRPLAAAQLGVDPLMHSSMADAVCVVADHGDRVLAVYGIGDTCRPEVVLPAPLA
jgi:tRNA pseudouridine55 synthase